MSAALRRIRATSHALGGLRSAHSCSARLGGAAASTPSAGAAAAAATNRWPRLSAWANRTTHSHSSRGVASATCPEPITDSSSCTFVSLTEGFSKFSDHWSPKIVGEVNGMHVKIVKLEGEFDWHHHDDEDELFLVTKGTMLMQFRDRNVQVNPGEFIIVPRLVEHCPAVPEGEVECMLFEPATTLNTGNVVSDKTVVELDAMTSEGDLKRGSGNEYNKAKRTGTN